MMKPPTGIRAVKLLPAFRTQDCKRVGRRITVLVQFRVEEVTLVYQNQRVEDDSG